MARAYGQTRTSTDIQHAGVYGPNQGTGGGVRSSSVDSDGMFGQTLASAGSGVYGANLYGGGYGVTGRAANGGVGMWADDSDGTGVALRTTGKIQFQKHSNTTVIAPGQKSRTITIPG
jgi:hypothetical protein